MINLRSHDPFLLALTAEQSALVDSRAAQITDEYQSYCFKLHVENKLRVVRQTNPSDALLARCIEDALEEVA